MKRYSLLLCIALSAAPVYALLGRGNPVDLPGAEFQAEKPKINPEEKLRTESEAKEAFEKKSSQMEPVTQKSVPQEYDDYYDHLVKKYSDNLNRFTLDDLVNDVDQSLKKQPNSSELKQTLRELEVLQNPSKTFGGYEPKSFKTVVRKNTKIQKRNRNNYKKNLTIFLKDKTFNAWLKTYGKEKPVSQFQFKNGSATTDEKAMLSTIEEYANNKIDEQKRRIQQAQERMSNLQSANEEIKKDASRKKESAEESLKYYEKVLSYAQELQKLPLAPTEEKLVGEAELPGQPLEKPLVFEAVKEQQQQPVQPTMQQKIATTISTIQDIINAPSKLDITIFTQLSDIKVQLNSLDKKTVDEMSADQQGLVKTFGNLIYEKLTALQKEILDTNLAVAKKQKELTKREKAELQAKKQNYNLLYKALRGTLLFNDEVAQLAKKEKIVTQEIRDIKQKRAIQAGIVEQGTVFDIPERTE
ncbi:MAG: hypothetical protein WCE21_02455 [Candidatus Babeliales bacterium]